MSAFQNDYKIDIEGLKTSLATLDKDSNEKMNELEEVVLSNKNSIQESFSLIENNNENISSMYNDIDHLKNRTESIEITVNQNWQGFENHKNEVQDRLNNIVGKYDRDIDAIDGNLTSLMGQIKTNTERITEINDLYSSMNLKHVETVEKIKEVTVLATNIDVHVKAQEQRHEEQRALESDGLNEKIDAIQQREIDLQCQLSDLQKNCEGLLLKLGSLEDNVTENEKLNAQSSKDIVSQISQIVLNIDKTDTNLQDIYEKFNSFAETNKLQGQKLLEIELLGDRLEQLADLRSKDEVKWNTLFESYKEYNTKELEVVRSSIESRIKELQEADLDALKNIIYQLRENLEQQTRLNQSNIQSLESLASKDTKISAQIDEWQHYMNNKFVDTDAEIQSILAKLLLIEDENKYNTGKLVAIEEANYVQKEKAIYVESLMGKMEEKHRQSESKSKEEMEAKVQDHIKTIEALRLEIDSKIQNFSLLLQQELGALQLKQDQLGSNIQEENRAALASLGNDQENKIIAIMKIIEEHKTLIEKTHTSVIKISEKVVHNETTQNTAQAQMIAENTRKIGDLQTEMESRFVRVESQSSDQLSMIGLNSNNLMRHQEEVNSSFGGLRQDILELKENYENERNLLVMRQKEDQNSLESFFKSLESRVDILNTNQIKETSRLERVEKQYVEQDRTTEHLLERITIGERNTDHLLDRLTGLEQVSGEHTTHLQAAAEAADKLGTELRDVRQASRDDIRSLRAEMDTDKENLWTLIVEIYSAFRGSTVVLKSDGAVKQHHADVLGVYRMIDHYNERPVYKQDGGENYIYYSATSNSWLVGTVVGHQYGWLRNPSENAGKRRWVPDLTSGWEYRPLVRGSDLNNTWSTDDGTLRIESLKDVEKVNELIRDIKNSASAIE